MEALSGKFAVGPEASMPALNYPLVDTPFGEHLKTFDPNVSELDSQYIVRTQTTIEPGGLPKEEVYGILEDLGEIYGEIINDLRDSNVGVVPTYFVSGDDDNGVPTLYLVAERVDGQNSFLDDFSSAEMTELVKPKFEELYLNILDYYHRNISTGQRFNDDIAGIRQYVFGTVAGQDEPGFHLVDTVPRSAEASHTVLIQLMLDLQRMVESMELRFAEGTVLDVCRQGLKSFLEGMDPAPGDVEKVKNEIIKDIISGRNGLLEGSREESAEDQR